MVINEMGYLMIDIRLLALPLPGALSAERGILSGRDR